MSLSQVFSSNARSGRSLGLGRAGGSLMLILALALTAACRAPHVPIADVKTYVDEDVQAISSTPPSRPGGAPRSTAEGLPGNSSGIVLLRPVAPPIDLDAAAGGGVGAPGSPGEGAEEEAEALLIREPWPNPVARGGIAAAEVGIQFDPVRFDYDSDILDFSARQQVIGYCNWLEDNPEVHITLEGHCDERGSSDYNYSLGMTRAWSVREMMVGRGIDPGRVYTISYGEEQPIAEGRTAHAFALNRRVEFRPFYPTRDGRYLSSLKEPPETGGSGTPSDIPPAQPPLELREKEVRWPPLTE